MRKLYATIFILSFMSFNLITQENDSIEKKVYDHSDVEFKGKPVTKKKNYILDQEMVLLDDTLIKLNQLSNYINISYKENKEKYHFIIFANTEVEQKVIEKTMKAVMNKSVKVSLRGLKSYKVASIK